MTRGMLVLLVLCAPALARDNGQYSNVSPEIRQWFREQKSPRTGAPCCNEADGTYAEEVIRDGVYWTRFKETNGEWIPVPVDVVIKEGVGQVRFVRNRQSGFWRSPRARNGGQRCRRHQAR